MEKGIKLVMLLVVLAICMPAQGEILIYNKTVRCDGAEAGETDDIYRETVRGFLILEVTYDGDEIVSVDDAIQIEYGRIDGEKYADYESHEFEIQRFDDGRNVLYSLVELDDVEGAGDFSAMLLHGNARATRIDPNEVPNSLNGYNVANVTDDFAQMCNISLRLQRRWTQIANESDMTIEEAYDEIRTWLVERGYPLAALPSS